MALLQAPVLRLADVAKPFKVHTDASDFVIGAVLLQQFNGGWHPVALISRKFEPRRKELHHYCKGDSCCHLCLEVQATLPLRTF